MTHLSLMQMSRVGQGVYREEKDGIGEARVCLGRTRVCRVCV